MRSAAALTATLLITADLAAGGAPARPLPSFDDVLEYLGFDEADRARVLQGEIVARHFREDHEKELTVAVVMTVPGAPRQVVENLRRGELLNADRDVIAFRMLEEDELSEETFAGIGYTPAEGKEIRLLLEASPGSTFNLSADEIERFQGLRRRFPHGSCDRQPDCAAAVVGEYRRVLLERARAYRSSGLRGVAPYVRAGGEMVFPAEEMREAAGDATLVAEVLPGFFRAFVDYPEEQGEHHDNQLLWVKQEVQGRPAFSLAHRLYYERPDVALIAERQFYVGLSYNTLQTFIGVLPHQDRSFVIYTNRTYTDQVAGFGSAIRHAIGRRKMIDAIVENFEDVRAHLQLGG